MGLELSIVSGTTSASDLAEGDQVEVCERIGEPTTYRLRYPLAITDADFPILTDGRLDPGGDLSVVVPDGSSTQVLVKGQVYGQRVHFHHDVVESWVEVIGGDTSMEMDRELKQKAWAPGAISDSVSSILSGYGVTPDVEAIAVTTTEEDHLVVQCETDLRFVRRMARRYGCWFWMTTDGAGTTTAHFKRPPLDGAAAITIAINNATPNVSSLDLDWDVERPTTAIAAQLGLRDKSPIDGQVERSPLRALGSTAFADVAAARGVHVVAPADLAGDLQARSEGALIEAGWFVRVRGQTSVRALGAVLRAHTLVGVSGLGTRHSGTYVVSSVRHVIDRTAHVMDFELMRNAWGAS